MVAGRRRPNELDAFPSGSISLWGGPMLPAVRRCAALACAAVVVVVVVFIGAASPAAAQTSAPVVSRPPVDAPVHDPFRAPVGPYGPGHRGIEYDTAPGTPIGASAD